jgi:formate hydrogenlyase transcriptional activator
VCPLSALRSQPDPQHPLTLLEMVNELSFRQPPSEVLSYLAQRLRSIVPLDCMTLDLRAFPQPFLQARVREGSEWPRDAVPIPPEFGAQSVWRNQAVLSIGDLATDKTFGLSWLRDRGIRCYCAFPLTTLHRKLGAIGFGSQHPYAFSDDDIQFLRCVAEIAALALTQSLPKRIIEEERGRLRLLLEISDVSSRIHDLRKLIAATLLSLHTWVPRNYVGLYLYDGTSRSLRLHMRDPQLAEKIATQALASLHGTLAGQVFRNARRAVLDRAALARISLPSVKRGTSLGVMSLCLIPLVTAKGPVGVLKVAARKNHAFSQRDVGLLEQVAALITPALDRAQSSRDFQLLDSGQSRISERAAVAFPKEPASALRGPVTADWFGDQGAMVTSEPLLDAYISTSGVGLAVLDRDLRFVALNSTLAKMNGIPPEQHLGKTVRELMGDLAEVVEPLYQRVLATREPLINIEVSSIVPKSSEPSHWFLHLIPIKDAGGEVRQIGAICIETTEQKKLEQSLRGVSEKLADEKKRQQVSLEISRLLASKWDPEHTFARVSAYLRRILRQEYAALALHDEKTGKLVRQAMDFPLGRSSRAGEEISVASGKALHQRSPLILTSAEVQGSDPQIASSLVTEGIKSLCCIPLLRAKDSLGVLVLGSTRANAFRNDDLNLLNQVAAQLTIALENARITREVRQLKRKLDQEKSYLEGQTRTLPQFEEIVGQSRALREVLEHALVVAPSDATVLILGETGTGKGLIAQAIHQSSARKGRRFVGLNCAAIPTGLLESELFGHEKGAFTGAVSQKIGRLELADKGTLFLDEIGDIPMELQPKLLRILQDHEFERLGGTKTIKVDLRLIAATNRDLGKSVVNKEFRNDLFYRLNVFPIRMPSLRERREDIPLLIRHFVRKFAERMGRVIETIPTETMEALVNWYWPGNVRELENFIERSVILTEGTALNAPLHELTQPTKDSSTASLAETEREHIIRVLRETGGVVSGPGGAAQRLGLKRTTLQSKMQRLGITRRDYLGQHLKRQQAS